MDPFLHWKKTFLAKDDKSKKGSIDAPIKLLLDSINKKEDYFTTSSCSGRISIRAQTALARKDEIKFLLKSHRMVRLSRVMGALTMIPLDMVWFRFEPMILHVACRDIGCANVLLDKVRGVFKHSGIISSRKRIVLEIRGSEFIEAPLTAAGKLVVDDGYLRLLLKEANQKLHITHRKIKECAKLLAN